MFYFLLGLAAGIVVTVLAAVVFLMGLAAFADSVAQEYGD